MNPPQGPGGNYGNYPPQGGGYGQPTDPGQGSYPPPAGGYQQQPGGYPPPAGGYQQPGGYPPPAGGYQQQPGGYPPQQQGYGQGGYGQTPPPKKGNTGLIIGIVVGLIVIIGAIVGIVLVVNGGNKSDNTQASAAATATSASQAITGGAKATAIGTVTAGAKTTAAGTSSSGTGVIGSIPAYPGLTSVTLPDAVKSQFAGSIGNVPNGTVDAFSSADDTAAIKSFYQSEFPKQGWNDLTSTAMGQADSSTLSQLETLGAFIIIYQKGANAVGIVGFPGSIASAAGVTGINAKDSLILIISGSGSAFTGATKATTTVAAGTTKAATTAAATKAATTAAAQQGGSAISVYPGAQQLEINSLVKSAFEQGFSSYKQFNYNLYASGDSQDKVVAFFKSELSSKGYTNVTESNTSGQRTLTAFSSNFTDGLLVLVYDSNTAKAYTNTDVTGKTVFLVLGFKL
ncbi:hypothetical protein OZ401_000659 [Candidatus Chlorohelix allophototropha]|uniref:Uncharacterized protein n=1 Tax=Candidatus Chlorohelix allophototropha TaxID=3003348 RepID=A0ABY9B2H7_9CHLR|nr:hypothetical protein OZ401_000659 [Chloroflexota bacterium L227-S17]